MSETKERKWRTVNQAEVDQALANSIKSGCGCDLPIFTFRTEGQTLIGRIRPCYKRDRNDRARCAHIYSYTDAGQETGIAIRLSSMLWAAIANKDRPLWGHWIRITYFGRERTAFGHYKNIFSVEVDKGTITEKFESVPMKKCKSRKPRKRRPVCSGSTRRE